MRFWTVWAMAAGILAAACEQTEHASAPTEASVSQDASSAEPAAPLGDVVYVSGETPASAARITGASAWAHPTLPQLSAILAVHDGEALVAYDFEGEELDRVEGGFSGPLSVAYPNAAGPALIAAYDGEGENIRFFDLTSAEREFSEYSGSLSYSRAVGLCAGGAQDAGKLIVLREGAADSFSIAASEDGEVLTSALDDLSLTAATACDIDNETGDVFIGLNSGEIKRLNADLTGSTNIFELADGSLVGLSLVDSGAGYLAVASDDGTVTIAPAASPSDRNALRLAASSGVDGVSAITAFAAIPGNFGSIYRDGVILIGDAEDDAGGANLKIAPWNGAANALGLSTEGRPDPRGSAPETGSEGGFRPQLISPDLVHTENGEGE